jgi:hypothetical protein
MYAHLFALCKSVRNLELEERSKRRVTAEYLQSTRIEALDQIWDTLPLHTHSGCDDVIADGQSRWNDQHVCRV